MNIKSVQEGAFTLILSECNIEYTNIPSNNEWILNPFKRSVHSNIEWMQYWIYENSK